MSTPIRIDICVCTFRRQHVAQTLRSIAAQTLPPDCTLRVIVADNDTNPSAQILVAQTAQATKLNVHYLHAPEANISLARNACLDAATADYIGFTDDDQIAAEGWLIALLTRARETGADITLGPVQAIYSPDAPRWLRAGDFHSNHPVWVNGKIITGYTGNVLMRRASPALQGLRFRLDLGVSGGEDTDYFGRAVTAGAVIFYAEQALMYEAVPPARSSLRWLMKRRFRYGQTHAMRLLERNKPRGPHIVFALTKMATCYVMAMLTCPFPVKRTTWLLRGTLHLGSASRLLRTPPATA
jgi:succinoglycan biosynthesis protein ExoM